MPVGPAGIVTLTGATYPTLALHGTVNPSIFGFKVETDSWVKIMATLCLISGSNFSSYGLGSQYFILCS